MRACSTLRTLLCVIAGAMLFHAPSVRADHGELFVLIDEDPNFFPATAEIIAATPSQSGFGDDASVSLAQSFTVSSAFTLQTIFLEYENDGGAPGDQTVTMSIFPVADVNASSHPEPPDANDFLLTESVTFPFVGETDTIAGIHLGNPLTLDPGGYMLYFTDTTSPGWEWRRTGSSGGNAYPDGKAYEGGVEKASGTRDFTLALSSVAISPPVLPIDTFSIQSGDLLAATTWENNTAPVGTPPSPNFIHNIVSGHSITADGAQPYNGAGVTIVDGSLTYGASAVHIPSVVVGEGTTVNETTNGEFFLGDINATELGRMELNGHLTITAEGGANAAFDMVMAGTGAATVNMTGGTLFLTDMSEFQGLLQFNGSGDEVLYEGPPGGAGKVVEMNSTGANRYAMALANDGGTSSNVIFNQPGQIDHRSDLDRLQSPGAITANQDVAIDLTKTYDGNERRLFASGGWHGSANITVNGTAADPTGGSVTLNEFESGGTTPDGPTATHVPSDSLSGTLTANDFVNVEVRRNLSAAEVVVNQNARLEFGHRDVESLLSTAAGDVAVNSGGSLEVGYEADGQHVPYNLRLTTSRGRSGGLTLADSATTVMQINGTGATQYDTIQAEGTVALDGILQLLINPTVPGDAAICDAGCTYAPVDGDAFEIISIVAEALPTDFNVDGVVNGGDLTILEATFGGSLANGDLDVSADANQDGIIAGGDFLDWQRDVGEVGNVAGTITGDFDSIVILDPGNALAGFDVTKTVTATSVTLTVNAVGAVHKVPEPGTGLLAISMLAFLMRVRGRKLGNR